MANVLLGLTLTTATSGGVPAPTDPQYANDDSVLTGSTFVGAGVYSPGAAYWIADLGGAYDLTSAEVHINSGGPGALSVEVAANSGGPWDEVIGVLDWPVANPANVAFTAGAIRYVRLVFSHGGGYGGTNLIQEWRVFGTATDPVVVGELPQWVPPEPAGPLIEIKVSDPDADTWDGVDGWGEAVWSSAAWQDITPLSVTATVDYGADDAGPGILADTVAGSWLVKCYDPDGDLDPSNEAGPYWPDIVPGTPIRINHRGLTLRTGHIDTVSYSYAEGTATIRAYDAIARIARATLADDAILSNGLFARAADVLAAVDLDGIGIVGIGPDPALSDRPEGERSAWEVIRLAARERLYVPMIHRTGELQFRAYAQPLQRGRMVTAPELVELQCLITDADQYSVVRALDAAGTATVERAYTPYPRYGRRVYERSETTYDADAWATAVLADRSTSSLRWAPGMIRPLTADSVEYLGTIQVDELISLVVPGVVAAQGIVLGGRFHVEWTRDVRPVWTWWLRVNASLSLGLVADQDGTPLVSDDDDTVLLIAD